MELSSILDPAVLPVASTSLMTVFYVLGGVLVLAALVTSFVGLRSPNFPGSPRALGAMLGVVAIVVVATAFFAIEVSSEEGEVREAELAELEVESDPGDTEEDSDDAEEPTSAGTDAEAGRALFTDTGCANCHALSDAGASAAVGPSLDSALQGETPEFVEESIVDPNAEIEEGFQANLMPQDYGETLSPAELDTLVAYLAEVGGADGSGARGDSGEVEGG